MIVYAGAVVAVGSLQSLLKYMRIRWLDAFIIMRISLDHRKAESLVKLYGALVVHLDVPVRRSMLIRRFRALVVTVILQEYAVEVPVLLHVVKDVIDHNRADSQSTVRGKASQSHYV